MNEQQIRQIVKDEIMNQYRSGSPFVPPHNHDGVNNLKINKENIINSIASSGSITFAEAKQYTLNISPNSNPTLILCYGNVTGPDGSETVKCITFGSAQIGKSYYLQPQSTSSVQYGGPIQPFIQSSVYFSTSALTESPFTVGSVHTITSEGHLVSIEYPKKTIHARLTLISINNSKVVVEVTDLDSGWEINVNLVII